MKKELLLYIFISREFANKVAVITRLLEFVDILYDLSQSCDNYRVLIYDVLHFLISILGQFKLLKRFKVVLRLSSSVKKIDTVMCGNEKSAKKLISKDTLHNTLFSCLSVCRL